ncbi:hypothetical protein CIW52_19770 [Mycolicibacterium sp. P9-64]|uniref:hypothetical protein n=1 Tax=Mycolicibacterium sp. P9-64 TaxID=2024612 RepID=UPI0011EDA1E6|nr:hypothetical protein [Mycolicibacterium sp. P9-64]KAA0081932.1 hypothetical protein CIW52_19770 [Mycolicibacterium sp. P9-64]
MIAANRDRVSIGFEAHLMVEDPDPMLSRWVDAGCEIVIVHAEACLHLHRTLSRIRELGARAGVALNPATPLAAARAEIDRLGLDVELEVDGGIGSATIADAAAAGATVFCAGSALFSGPGTMADRTADLRTAATNTLVLQ